jgi:hypothetical protein
LTSGSVNNDIPDDSISKFSKERASMSENNKTNGSKIGSISESKESL